MYLHVTLISARSLNSHVVWKVKKKVTVLVTQSCLTLCNPVDYSPPGSSVHGILQERILEWVSILFSRGSSQTRYQTQVSCTAGRFFTICATREAPSAIYESVKEKEHNTLAKWHPHLFAPGAIFMSDFFPKWHVLIKESCIWSFLRNQGGL